MIPEHLLKYAEAKYFCNVYEIIEAGLGREVLALEVCHLKTRYPIVGQWFDSLEQQGQSLVIEKLEIEYHSDQERKSFFNG